MFNIPDIISFGPFVVPLHYLFFAIIGYTATYFIYQKSKSLHVSHKTWLEILLNGILTYIVVWKFSFVLFDPLSIVRSPSIILVGTGGFFGNIAGIIIGLLVIITLITYWIITPNYGLSTTLPWGISFENSTMAYHPLHWYTLFLGVGILFYYRMKKVMFGSGELASFSLFLFGLGLLAISNFSYQSNSQLGLSPLQWVYLGMTIIGLVAYFYLNKQKDHTSAH